MSVMISLIAALGLRENYFEHFLEVLVVVLSRVNKAIPTKESHD